MPKKKAKPAPAREVPITPAPAVEMLTLLGQVSAGERSQAEEIALAWLDGGPSPLQETERTGEHYMVVRDIAGTLLLQRVAARLQTLVDEVTPSLLFFYGWKFLQTSGQDSRWPLLRPDSRALAADVEEFGRVYSEVHSVVHQALGAWWKANQFTEAFDFGGMPFVPEGFADVVNAAGLEAKALTARALDGSWQKEWTVWHPADGNPLAERMSGQKAVRSGLTFIEVPEHRLWEIARDRLPVLAEAYAHVVDTHEAAVFTDEEILDLIGKVAPKWPYRENESLGRLSLFGRALRQTAFLRYERHKDAQLIEAQKQREAAESRAAAAEARAKEAERRARPAVQRQPTGFLISQTRRADHIQKARRKNEEQLQLSQADIEARTIFVPEPVSAAQQAVIVALANQAREMQLTSVHPVALQFTPAKNGHEAPRLAIPFEGYSALARRCGAKPGADGRISKADARKAERALKDLVTHARNIPVPVRIAVRRNGGTEYVDDIEVHRTLWIEATTQVLAGGTMLHLHPQAVAGMHKSWVEHPDGLLARYEIGKRALGLREMRDEWAACDNYLLNQAKVKATSTKLRTVPEGTTVVGTVVQEIRRSLFWEQINLAAKAKKEGRPWGLQREAEALKYCQAVGSLVSYSERKGKDGEDVLVFVLPDPVTIADPEQTTFLLPELAPGST